MKKILLSILLFANSSFAQIKNGEAVIDIGFKPILNAPVKNIQLNQLKGKVILIEFWATWCGACLSAMPHLKKLQEQYPKDIQVITVTDETPQRTQLYLKSRPSNLWFAIDTGRKVSSLFPHQLIPHTVVISPEGKLIANTNPESVTAAVIDRILKKKEVHLPEKKDKLIGHEQLMKTYFSVSDTMKSSFNMLPEIKGAAGMSTIHLNDPIFSERRLTAMNVSLKRLYMIAYGNFDYNRVVDQRPKETVEPLYCLDLVVPDKKDLLNTLKRELLKRFDLQANLEQHEKEVSILTISDSLKFARIPRNTSGKRTYYSRHGEIDQEYITMVDFADFLENFGLDNTIVIDETHNTAKLDIKFSFQPENPDSLIQVLKDMGLSLKKERRKVDFLVIH